LGKNSVQWQNAAMDIRQRLQLAIDARAEISARSLSLKAGLSDSMLHKFLTGATDSITVKNLEKVAGALDVDMRWLMFGEGDPEPATDIGAIFNRIPESQRLQAIAVLETFARTGTDG
jgi:transcriptional regulator with XRE-family HTH domain